MYDVIHIPPPPHTGKGRGVSMLGRGVSILGNPMKQNSFFWFRKEQIPFTIDKYLFYSFYGHCYGI